MRAKHSPLKTTIVFLTVFLLLPRLPLAARKERRGAQVEVSLTDGSRVQGELLAVKTDALLIYETNRVQGKNLDLSQIQSVKVVKRSKAWTGLAIGAAAGLGLSTVCNSLADEEDDLVGILYFIAPPAFGLGGAILGALFGTDQVCHFAAASPWQIQDNLRGLKRFARNRDIDSQPATAIPEQALPPPVQKPRIRLLWLPRHQNLANDSGLNGKTGTFSFDNQSPSQSGYPSRFDSTLSYLNSDFKLGQFRMEIELTPHLSPSIELTSSAKLDESVYSHLSFYSDEPVGRYDGFFSIFNQFSHSSVMIGLNWKPFLVSFSNRHVIGFGIAAGPAWTRLNMDYLYSKHTNPRHQFNKLALSCKAEIAYDFYFSQHFSLGLFWAYQHLKVSYPGVSFHDEQDSFWPDNDYRKERITRATNIIIPERTVQLGGSSNGIRIGYRF